MAWPRARSWRRRVRHSMALAVNVPKAMRLAGGPLPFAALAWQRLTTHGLNHWLTWLIGAVSWVQRANGVWYRRWLAAEATAAPAQASVPTLLVFSTTGLSEDVVAGYLEAVARAECPPQTYRLLITDAAGCACVKSSASATYDLPEVVGVDRLSVGTVVHCAKSRFEAGGSMGYRLLVLLGPGYLPSTMPCLGSDGGVLYYGDEDCVDAAGQRQRPFFKCGYSPDLLMHQDYISSWMALTSELVARLPPPSIADSYDLALMLAEAADRVEHVGAFVAQRHLPSLGTATVRSSAPRYLQSFLRNRYGEGASIARRGAGWTCHFGNADRFVSVVIPTKDRADLLDNCVRGIYETNAAASFEVIVIDNGSEQRSTAAWLRDAKCRFERFRVVPAPQPFNWSRLNNIGAAQAEGDVLVFLNNDTVPRSADWLARLADVACRSEVGLVGALLLYSAGTIQHAGVVTGFGGCADHVYKGTPPSDDDDHMFVSPTAVRNVSAVTGACMAISKRAWGVIGPFDERYRVAGGDVEICLRALTKGFLNVYLPDVELLHLESQSRSTIDPESDVTRLKALVAGGFAEDVWYNRRLSMVSTYPSYPIFPPSKRRS